MVMICHESLDIPHHWLFELPSKLRAAATVLAVREVHGLTTRHDHHGPLLKPQRLSCGRGETGDEEVGDPELPIQSAAGDPDLSQ